MTRGNDLSDNQLNWIINNVPPDMKQLIAEWTGVFLPWSKNAYEQGWRCFDFTLSVKKDIHFKARQNIYIRNKKQMNLLNKIYPHLKLFFKKTYEHEDLEIITGLKWDKLLKLKKLHINGFESDSNNKKLHQNINTINNTTWKLPSVISQLTQLQEFGISESTCIRIPESIGKMINLKEIWWVDNDYEIEMPKSIEYLKKLEKIVAQTNVIPYGITRLPFLIELYLYGENIDMYDLTDIDQLEVLSISKCKFTNNELPCWFGNFKNLKELIVEECDIQKLNKSLLKLDLDYLCFNENKIETLPSWFYNIRSSHVSLVNNEIEELPVVPSDYKPRINFLEIYNNPLRIINNLSLIQNFTNLIIDKGDEGTLLCEQDKNYIRSKNNINILNTTS